MRQGQHNKRARGRGRKPQNVNRTFESNGPDVKIRGTAATIAEKYLSLARDAQASGDPVASENYLQHAEHYFRIIAAAQAYAQSQHQAEQPHVMNGHGDGDDDEREFRPMMSPGPNGSQTGERAGQDGRTDQQAAEGSDESGGEGRGRRNRGRRGRRGMPGDDMDSPVSTASGPDAAEPESAGSADSSLIVEAGR